MQYPPQPPQGAIPIEQYLANLSARRDALQLQLNNVNAQMANIRAHYNQARSNFIFKPSAHAKDHQLRKLQPEKERLTAQIAAVRAEIARVKALKQQGVKWITGA